MNRFLYIITLTAITVAFLALLTFQFPFSAYLPDWYWQYDLTALDNIWLMALLFPVALFAVNFAVKNYQNRIAALLILIAAAYVMQMTFGILGEQGFGDLRNIISEGEYSKYAEYAAEDIGIREAAVNYEKLMIDGKLSTNMNGHPTGLLIFYMGLERVVSFFAGANGYFERMYAFSFYSMYIFPLLASLSIIPLFTLSRKFLKNNMQFVPAVIFMLAPAFILLPVRPDNFLAPLLFLTALSYSIGAVQKRSIFRGIIAGIIIYIFAYFTFSILALIPILIFYLIWDFLSGAKPRPTFQAMMNMAVSFVAGFLAAYLIFQVFLNYDFTMRLSSAYAHRLNKAGMAPEFGSMFYYAFLKLTEFLIWAGIPVAILFIINTGTSFRKIFSDEIRNISYFKVAAVLTLILLAFLTPARAESAKLWLFFLPLLGIFAADALQRKFEGDIPHVITLIAILQFFTLFFMRFYF